MCPAVVNCRRRIRNINQFERLLLFFFLNSAPREYVLCNNCFINFVSAIRQKQKQNLAHFYCIVAENCATEISHFCCCCCYVCGGMWFALDQ